MTQKKHPFLVYYLPTIGILLFFVLFFVASAYYPGGSYHNRSATSFSWMHNYWCNMMEVKALNGEPNDARITAITATFILCFGIASFYYLFPRYFVMRKFWKWVIEFLGIGSMIFAVFLFTQEHDLVLNIAGGLGGFALLGTLVALRHHKLYGLLWLGRFSILLILVNNYMYYTRVQVVYLPFIQKISLFIVLVWIIAMNIAFKKTVNTNED